MKYSKIFSISSLITAFAMVCTQGYAQAPAILWSTNVGAVAFAIDGQTNVYAYNGGSVIVINGNGVMIHSNLVCPAVFTTAAGRDAAGNLYFAGAYGGVQDFGGMSLTNNTGNGWFTAKYNSAGILQWVKGFGPGAPWFLNSVGNIQLDAAGNVYVAYNYGYNLDNGEYQDNQGQVMRFDSGGNSATVAAVDAGTSGPGLIDEHGAARVGAVTANSGALLDYFPGFEGSGSPQLKTGFWTNNTDGAYYPLVFPTGSPLAFPPPTNAGFAVSDLQGNIISLQGSSFMKMSLASNVLVNVTIGQWWTVGGDIGGGVHVANGGQLARYDTLGNQVWHMNLTGNCIGMVVDTNGNRFFSLGNGVVSRLAGDYFPPTVSVAPAIQTVFYGSNAVFTASPTGSTPYYYKWLFNGGSLPGNTNAMLSLTNVGTNNAGQYSVIVTNYVGSITSSPVTLRVKRVEIFNGAQLLTNGTYHFNSPPTLSINSAFVNGQTFYTLDGSTPDFNSTPYTGPFSLSNNATINAIGYSADFTQTEYADAVVATVPPQYTLTATTAGGGTINLNPSGGIYASNTTVTATATPASGFSFLYWQGAAAGSSPSASIVMNTNLSINAVFGTTLGTTAAGGGQVLGSSGQLFPYGAVVRLEALPQSGNYFVRWGNAASGTNTPLYFTVTNSGQSVSSLFSAVPSNEAALTLLIQGKGTVNANPPGNVFSTSQSVIITATPDAGQSFLGWSGDASGSQNPLTVSMTQSRVITARFSGQSVAFNASGSARTSQGFRFTLMGDPGTIYHILSSSNLTTWQDMGMVTNTSGTVQVTDTNTTGAAMKYYRAVLTQ